MFIKNSHCNYCGTSLKEETFPRSCTNCSQVTYVNPIPVSVVLVPVDNGLLVIRRGIEPGKGKLALPGGFMELNETWQEAAARELYEETEIKIDPKELTFFDLVSVPGLLLIFSLAKRKTEKELPSFKKNDEITERLLIYKQEELVFPAHTIAVEQYFKKYSI